MKQLVLSVILLLLVSINSNAQTVQNNQGFQPFWTKFRAAVANNDKEAIASMTKLPFLFESKERTRAEFIKIYSQLFDAKVRKCFARAKVLREGELYEVFCAKNIFYFGEVDGQFKFTEFGVDY